MDETYEQRVVKQDEFLQEICLFYAAIRWCDINNASWVEFFNSKGYHVKNA